MTCPNVTHSLFLLGAVVGIKARGNKVVLVEGGKEMGYWNDAENLVMSIADKRKQNQSKCRSRRLWRQSRITECYDVFSSST
ncbi:hypothetical protein CPC08DRAFT_714756 [Agrocybe pediades]|nr:hypothetical protein CPC08DRAFT_714756 [Agrocybe pediades]